jgi:hypothetical protein
LSAIAVTGDITVYAKLDAKLVAARPSLSKRLGSQLIEIFMQTSRSGVDVFYDDLDTCMLVAPLGAHAPAANSTSACTAPAQYPCNKRSSLELDT